MTLTPDSINNILSELFSLPDPQKELEVKIIL